MRTVASAQPLHTCPPFPPSRPRALPSTGIIGHWLHRAAATAKSEPLAGTRLPVVQPSDLRPARLKA